MKPIAQTLLAFVCAPFVICYVVASLFKKLDDDTFSVDMDTYQK